MDHFASHNRKTSPYMTPKRASPAFKRKISGYFTLLITPTKDKPTYLPARFILKSKIDGITVTPSSS
jgi:hypothetical protein